MNGPANAVRARTALTLVAGGRASEREAAIARQDHIGCDRGDISDAHPIKDPTVANIVEVCPQVR